MAFLMLVVGLLVGSLVGSLVAWLLAAARWSARVGALTGQLSAQQDQVQALAHGRSALSDTFRALSADALRESTEQLLALAETRLRVAGTAADADLARR